VSRFVCTSLLLLTCLLQAVSGLQARACPMLGRAEGVDPGCEHCPPPPEDVALRSALPDCCVLHAARVETAVSEPVRAPHPASSPALAPPHVLVTPVALPLAPPLACHGHGPAPGEPPRNLPLLS